jgi:hypothetical protein
MYFVALVVREMRVEPYISVKLKKASRDNELGRDEDLFEPKKSTSTDLESTAD